jgi:hypothetical protein
MHREPESQLTYVNFPQPLKDSPSSIPSHAALDATKEIRTSQPDLNF